MGDIFPSYRIQKIIFPTENQGERNLISTLEIPFLEAIYLCFQALLCKALCIQSLSLVLLFAAPWTATCQGSLSFTISWSLLKFMFIESVMLFSIQIQNFSNLNFKILTLGYIEKRFLASVIKIKNHPVLV